MGHSATPKCKKNGQLETKGENLRLQGGAGPKTKADSSKKGHEKEFIVERGIISRMIVNPAFSDPTEISVTTAWLRARNSGYPGFRFSHLKVYRIPHFLVPETTLHCPQRSFFPACLASRYLLPHKYI